MGKGGSRDERREEVCVDLGGAASARQEVYIGDLYFCAIGLLVVELGRTDSSVLTCVVIEIFLIVRRAE